MSSQGDVLIIGPGFIGWNVLDNLVNEGYRVTGFVRRQAHAAGITKSGGIAVLGDLDDKEKITKYAKEFPIILHTATADHLPSVEAVLDAIHARAAENKLTLFIHTSGTSVLDDNAQGEAKSDKIYHDNQRKEIDSVPDAAPHRKIDLAIVRAQKELGEKAKLAIMIPPLIYGFNSAHQRLTIQIPTLTRFAMKHGFAGYVGEGSPVESHIHVKDLARGYVVLLHHMERSDAKALLDNPYYFCEATGDKEPSWKDVASEIGKGLYSAKKISDPTPKTIPPDLYEELFGQWTAAIIGLNSRSRAIRLRELGWKPTEKDFAKSYHEDELPAILKEDNNNRFVGYRTIGSTEAYVL